MLMMPIPYALGNYEVTALTRKARAFDLPVRPRKVIFAKRTQALLCLYVGPLPAMSELREMPAVERKRLPESDRPAPCPTPVQRSRAEFPDATLP